MRIKSIECTELNQQNHRIATSRYMANSYIQIKEGQCIKTRARNIIKPKSRRWLMVIKLTTGQWIFDKKGW